MFFPQDFVAAQNCFPRDEHVSFEWLKQVDETLAEFNRVASECSAGLDESAHIDAFLTELEAPDFVEQFHPRIAEKTALAHELFRDGRLEMRSTSRKRQNKFPVVPRWLAMTPETELELWMRWRLESQVESFRLAFDGDRSRFLRYHAATSQISQPHVNATKLFEEGRHPDYADGGKFERITDSTVIITFALFHPLRGFKTMEIDCLGSNTFAELKDKLDCDEETWITKERYLFSFILTSGMYVLDGRRPDAQDFSARILEHLQRYCPEQLLAEGARRSMQALLLGNCELHFNTRGAYFHCGDCEHRLVPTAMRKFTPGVDCPYVAAYPLVTFRPPTKTTELCQACVAFPAELVVFNSLQCPVNPTLLCPRCHEDFACPADPLVFTTTLTNKPPA